MKSKGLWQGGGSREGSRNTADIEREMGKMGKGAVTGEREWRSIQKEGGGTNNTKIVWQSLKELYYFIFT